MSTATAYKPRESLSFTSGNREKIHTALRMVFGIDGASYVCWYIDENGFHTARMGSGHTFIPDGRWLHRDRPVDHLPMIASDIIEWLDTLNLEERRRLCGSTPMEETYIRYPGIGWNGFRAVTVQSDDGEHHMLTFTPHWA